MTDFSQLPEVLRTGKRFPSVRIVRLEGDQASPTDIDLFRRHFDQHCTLVNGLGTTETGIVRQYFIGHEGPLPQDVVPIGYPSRTWTCRSSTNLASRPLSARPAKSPCAADTSHSVTGSAPS